MASILRYTKEVYKTFKEVNGNYKLDTTSLIGKLKLKDEDYAFLASYLDFVMNSGVLSSETKIYITSIENNTTDAVRAYNLNNPSYQISTKKMTNHIYYDTKRLLELFPDDMITKIIYRKGDLEIYKAMLENALKTRCKKTLLKEVSILALPSTILSEKPTDKEIDEFFVMFSPYTKKIISIVESELSRNVIGYINYISSKSKNSITDEEREIISRLEALGKKAKDRR